MGRASHFGVVLEASGHAQTTLDVRRWEGYSMQRVSCSLVVSRLEISVATREGAQHMNLCSTALVG